MLSLTPETQKLIKRRMKKAGYKSADDAIRAALASLDQTPNPWFSDRPAAASLRGDLLSDDALARAAPILKSGRRSVSQEMREAQQHALALARQSVSLAPHSSRTWLLIAMLQGFGSSGQAGAEAALKMSYLTSPAAVDLAAQPDEEAINVLIELLAVLPPPQRRQAEHALQGIAEIN